MAYRARTCLVKGNPDGDHSLHSFPVIDLGPGLWLHLTHPSSDLSACIWPEYGRSVRPWMLPSMFWIADCCPISVNCHAGIHYLSCMKLPTPLFQSLDGRPSGRAPPISLGVATSPLLADELLWTWLIFGYLTMEHWRPCFCCNCLWYLFTFYFHPNSLLAQKFIIYGKTYLDYFN